MTSFPGRECVNHQEVHKDRVDRPVSNAIEGTGQVRPHVENKCGRNEPQQPKGGQKHTQSSRYRFACSHGWREQKRKCSKTRQHEANETEVHQEQVPDKRRQRGEMRSQPHGPRHGRPGPHQPQVQHGGDSKQECERCWSHNMFPVAPM
jgi:hypothetical protein